MKETSLSLANAPKSGYTRLLRAATVLCKYYVAMIIQFWCLRTHWYRAARPSAAQHHTINFCTSLPSWSVHACECPVPNLAAPSEQISVTQRECRLSA